jgi:vitamin B12 transporter
VQISHRSRDCNRRQFLQLTHWHKTGKGQGIGETGSQDICCLDFINNCKGVAGIQRANIMRKKQLAGLLRSICTVLGITITINAFSQDAAKPPTVPSDTAPEMLPETVVIGRPGSFPRTPLNSNTILSPGGLATSQRTNGNSVTIIGSAELERSGHTTVLEALRNQLGIATARSGGNGSLTSLFLRGSNSAHTKVLLDGIPLNDPSSASRAFDFGNLTTDNIERIEILRGPQSVLYGSDAIGGVINIITKRGSGPREMKLSVYGGSLGTSFQSLRYSGGDDNSYYSIGGSYLDTHSVSQAAARFGNNEHDDFDVGTLSGRFGWNPSETLNIDYVFRSTSADVEVDDWDFGDPNPVDNLIRANLTRNFSNRIQISKTAMEGRLEHRVGFSLTDYQRIDTAVPNAFFDSFFQGQRRTVDYQTNYVVNDNNLLTVGSVYEHEEAESENNPLDNQTNAAVFLQNQMTLRDNWHATVGVRWDDYSTAGQANTYRLNSIYYLNDIDKLHASLGTGFRAPALAENLFAFGNPDLQPETSKGWEFGYTWSLFNESVLADVTYFRNDFEDLIVWNPSLFILDNIGYACSAGVEVSLAWQFNEQTRIDANYTLTDTIDRSTGAELLRRPRHRAHIALSRALSNNKTEIGFSLGYTGSRLDNPPGLAQTELKHFMLLNLHANHQIDKHWLFFVRAQNITNESYEEIYGFGTPGATVQAGLTLTR